MWRDIKRVFKKHHRFVLTTHVNPDGDGIGSACALAELLLHQNKKVRFVCDSPLPLKFRFLDCHGLFEEYDPQGNYVGEEVLVALDTHRKERLGRVADLADAGLVTVCIDHHPPDQAFAQYPAIDPTACSAGAMVYSLFKECGVNLTLPAANSIYASVVCDTGRFSYSSTNRKAHKIADECIKVGVNPDRVFSRLFQHLSLAQIKIFAQALLRMEMHLNNRVLVQEITRDDCNALQSAMDLENLDLEYILEFDKLIEDAECIVLLRELEENKVRISLRSTSDLDVNQLIRPLHGGGHSKAAGAIMIGSLAEVKQQVLALFK